MASWHAAEAAQAAGGRLVAGAPDTRIEGAAIDSRAVRGGELFLAFPGTRRDGHDFVGDAFARGAAAAVVSRRVAAADGAVIEVADTLTALHGLARSLRRRVPERLVAITGSAGKTTTKELLAAMLEVRFRVARTPGNRNNLIGFPLALLNAADDSEWMVAEMGMSTPGELAQLSRLGRPDVALFTIVRPVHLEFFADLRAIAEAKAELLSGLAPNGLVLANADDPEVARIARRHAASGGRVVWYGMASDEAEVRARGVVPELSGPGGGGGVGSRFRLEAGGRSQAVRLPLHGLYNVENCLAAAACAWSCGIGLEEIAAAVRGVQPAARRGVVHRAEAGFTVVDDSYNSNPDALARALEAARRLPAERRLAVLGEMLELGPEAPRLHRESGERAARLGFSPLAGVGELARELVAGARAAGAATVWHPDAAAAAAWVAEEARRGDVVLVKGSRSVGLETVVQRLLAPPEPAG